MARSKKKKKKILPRNWGVVAIIERGSGGAMKDRKKAADKKKCRGKIEDES